MKPTVSVLLPSRGNPDKCSQAIRSLLLMADHPTWIEIILRLDRDDPTREDYPAYIEPILGQRYGGYQDLNRMYEECATFSKGDVLLIYNDDLKCVTKGWDSLYLKHAHEHPLRPMCCRITGDHYHWAFPAVSRQLYRKVGNRICPSETFVVDRIWHEVANAKGWTADDCRVEVTLHHDRIEPENGPEDRKHHMRYVNQDWQFLQAKWKAEGEAIAKTL